MEITKEIVLFEGSIYTRHPMHEDAREKNYFRDSQGKQLHIELWKAHNKQELPKGFCVHHKNFNPLDNSIKNLECITREEHTRIHKHIEWKSKEYKKFICHYCGKDFLSRSSQLTTNRYCSQKCRRAAWVKEFTCLHCGKIFKSRKDSRGMYCSKWCSNIANGRKSKSI